MYVPLLSGLIEKPEEVECEVPEVNVGQVATLEVLTELPDVNEFNVDDLPGLGGGVCDLLSVSGDHDMAASSCRRGEP